MIKKVRNTVPWTYVIRNFPELKSLGGRVKVQLDLSNYATKTDLKRATRLDTKRATRLDTSSFAKKTD